MYPRIGYVNPQDLLNDDDRVQIIHHEPQRNRRRQYRCRIEYGIDGVFYERFRLKPLQAETLLRIIGPRLMPNSRVHTAMSAKAKLLAALRFYATGSYYYSVGDAQGYGKSVVCRSIRVVTNAICEVLFPRNVRWPRGIPMNRRISDKFFNLRGGGIRNVCGAVDGTLIAYRTPRAIERAFVDRYWSHSINALCVADSDLIFRAHAKSRRVVECAFGMLKSRFACLSQDSQIRVRCPRYAARIIKTCVALHNFIIEQNVGEEDDVFINQGRADLNEEDNIEYDNVIDQFNADRIINVD